MNLSSKIRRLYKRLHYRPIRVFVFHHVSDVRDPLVSGEHDWSNTEQFKLNIQKLRRKYKFISIDEAWEIISKGIFRFSRYAVLTTDDGLQSVLHVVDWLVKNEIPLTCFVNAKYLDGCSCKSQDITRIKKVDANAVVGNVIKRQYMTYEQLFSLTSPYVSIGLHGYEHINAKDQPLIDFRQNVIMCDNILKKHPRYVPFFAYPWGGHTAETDQVLKENGLVPVLVDGMVNREPSSVIHRVCIDNIIL